MKRLARESSVTQASDSGTTPPIPPHMSLRPVDSEAPGDLVMRTLCADNTARWDEYVGKSARATLYHDSRWARIICGPMGQQNLSIMAVAQSQVVGVLPLYRLTSRLFGDFAVSVPYVNYGGPIGDSTGIEAALLAEALSIANLLGLQHVELREMYPREVWQVRTDKVSMVRRLPRSVETLNVEVGSKIRAQIRKGEREGLSYSFGGIELLDDFYRVFARNMRDLGTPVYGKRLFRDVIEVFSDASEILLVRQGSKPVGGALLLAHRDVLEVPWASTIREANSLGTGMFMYWNALCRAIDHGMMYFDFGRSSEDSGTYRFKKQWGATPIKNYWHYGLCERSGIPLLHPRSGKYDLAISFWKRLPVPFTRLVGPSLARNLP